MTAILAMETGSRDAAAMDESEPRPDPPRAHHDMGGVSRLMCEPIDTTPHGLSPFDKEVDAMVQVLRGKGLLGVDELRRGIEAIPGPRYDRMSYYERWLRSIADNLLARGTITHAELAAALEAGA